MRCRRCGKENPDDALFCIKCGLDLTRQRAEDTAPAEVMFCYRHPKEETVLRCGRCERPVCSKCVILGPAGPRCPECAKTKIAFRPGAVGLEIKRVGRSIFRTSPWTIWMMIVLAGFLFSMFRGCSSSFNPQPPPADEREFSDFEQEN